MVITEILARNARMYGDEIALVEREPAARKRSEMTWRQFHILSNQTANALRSQGVEKGDRVVQLMMNCIEWLPVYFGILRAGAIAVPLNFRFQSADISRCVRVSGARTLIFGEEFIERVGESKAEMDQWVKTYVYVGSLSRCPSYCVYYKDFIQEAAGDAPNVSLNLWDGAGIYFTSGTTGKPKGVYLTHRNLESACYVENRHHNQTHTDNFLCIPPLYHAGAKMHWFGNLIVGARAVILKGIRPEMILRVISEEQVTIVWLLVPWVHDILVAIENQTLDLCDYHLDQWRLMHIGAQPVPPSLVQKWRHYFPNHAYDTNYGLTEATGPGCVHLGLENFHKVGSIGIPGFDWECRIVNEDGADVADGEPGELLVKGPGVMTGYYKNPDKTEAVLKDGWLHTGDIARKDGDGFNWLIDRKKDVIITGGENIFPVEVESFLMTHEDIFDAGVIGVPDTRLGEVVAAVIAAKPGKRLVEEEIARFCEALPKYKRPRRFFFDDVPRNPTGKIEKPRLRDKYSK
ncbi:MAG: acyl--CoA ligase [Desulfobacterales bacterium]|nr:acyl--CoA ligase [Desulfobacterales bacterium]